MIPKDVLTKVLKFQKVHVSNRALNMRSVSETISADLLFVRCTVRRVNFLMKTQKTNIIIQRSKM